MKPIALAMALAGSSAAPGPPPPSSWSFEAGLPARFSVRVRSAVGYAAEPEFDERDVHATIVAGGSGSAHSLSIAVPARGRVVLHTPLAAAHGRCTFSSALRASPPGAATLRLFESEKTDGKAYGARSRELGARSVDVGEEWSTATVTAECGRGGVFGEIEVPGERVVLVDDVTIATGAEPTPGPPAVEIGVAIAPSASGVAQVFLPGETVAIRALLPRPLRPGERVLIEVRDARDRLVRVARLPTDPLLFRAAPSLLGPHRVTVVLSAGARVVASAERAFAVLPPPSDVAAARAPLGTHTRLDVRHLALARRLGFRWLRLHDASMVGQWITVEPEPGARVFFDEQIDRARAAGFGLLGVLEATPRWASSAPPAAGFYEARAFPPSSLDAWARYVAATLTHYRGRVDRWEVWNEPYFAEFWRGTPEGYGALAAAAARAAEASSDGPRLLVSVASEHQRLAWSRAALAGAAAGGARPAPLAGLGGAAAHLYDPRLVEPSEALGACVAALRALVGEAPWWMTEGSVLGASASLLPRPAPLEAVDVERGAAGMVAWLGELLALGAERAFVYQLIESPFESDADLSLLDADGAPRPAACALAAFSAILDGRRFLRTAPLGKLRGLVFGGDERAPVVLVEEEGLRGFEVRGSLKGWRDVFGNSLVAGQESRVALYQPPSAQALDLHALAAAVRTR